MLVHPRLKFKTIIPCAETSTDGPWRRRVNPQRAYLILLSKTDRQGGGGRRAAPSLIRNPTRGPGGERGLLAKWPHHHHSGVGCSYILHLILGRFTTPGEPKARPELALHQTYATTRHFNLRPLIIASYFEPR